MKHLPLKRLRSRTACCCALALLFTLAGAPAAATPPVPFIDAHVHLNDPQMQLALMDRFGVERAVVFWGGRSSNESVAQAARDHPDRFIAFASISPERRSYQPAWRGNGDANALLAELDALLASGQYRGIGEINAVHFESAGFAETDYALASPMMDGIMALARRHRVPVMLHVESTRMAELSALLERFADVPVIWAHGGYTPLILARRMLAQHPQLYYELSARTWPRHPRSPEFTLLRDGRQLWPEWLKLIEAMPERFLVGTDASHRDPVSEQMKFASVQNFLSQLSPAAQARVGRDNLLRLLGLDSGLR
ncbi:amidohydrolase family protein [Xenophilus arseniciresistens]|uniref:Amidohydrolase family protein n=1 Tax=Xenophilus arseniciresistens TaxID=1283306 RepID=A0AAE3N8V5_9BURK|nr:TatD family hydrolase [Xenophilus arseniciresistens]MDA7416948.1 amidohydrolase family protein [Xenophilus arseniciresistens]